MALSPVVSDFRIDSVVYDERNQILDLSFSFIKGNDFESGYEFHFISGEEDKILNRYIDATDLIHIDDRETAILEVNGRKVFSYRFFPSDIVFGRLWSFYLRVFYKDRETSSIPYNTQFLNFRAPIDQINDFVAHYDGFNMAFEWSVPSLDEVTIEYDIEQAEMRQTQRYSIIGQATSGVIFSSPDIAVTDFVVVHNILTNTYWSGIATSNTVFEIDNLNIFNSIEFFNYTAYDFVNYDVFITKSSDYKKFRSIRKQSFSGSDKFLFPSNNKMFSFRLLPKGSDVPLYSNVVFGRSFDITNRQALPYPIYESKDSLYGNQYFIGLRNLLVDENYYNKETYALPYKENLDGNVYSLAGYTGTSNSIVELYLDGQLYQTVWSDKKGEYVFQFNSDKKTFEIQIIAYLDNRLKQFVPYERSILTKIYAYTHFGILAQKSVDLSNHFKSLIDQLSIKRCSYENLVNYYAAFIGLSPGFQDTQEEFREQIEFLFPVMYNNTNPGNNLFMTTIMDFYSSRNYNILDYYYFDKSDIMNNSYNAMHLENSLFHDVGRLGKNRYKYFVTAESKNNPGIESYPAILEVDYRIFEGPDSENYPAICMQWDVSGKTDDIYYNVYRQVNNNRIYLLAQTDGIAFIDDGKKIEVEKEFPTFGYCDINYIRNLRFVGNNTVNEWLLYKYSYNLLMLVIYEDQRFPIKDSVKSRIDFILRSQVPAEKYFVIKYIQENVIGPTMYKMFWFVSEDPDFGGSDKTYNDLLSIPEFVSKPLSQREGEFSSRTITRSFNATGGKYIYIMFPVAMEINVPHIQVGQFPVTLPYVRQIDFDGQEYYVLRTQLQHGSEIVVQVL